MEIGIVFIRITCLFIFVVEVFLISTVETLGVSDVQFPSKFSNLNHHELRPERRPTARNSRSDVNIPNTIANFPFNKSVIEQSKILHFIEKIRTNESDRNSWCQKSKNIQTVTLSDFHYTFNSSSFQRYKRQLKSIQFLARYLTELFTWYITEKELKSSNDEHVHNILSVLRIIVHDDPHIVGGGIAFASHFFPYVFKTKSNDLETKDYNSTYNYTSFGFFPVHSKRNYAAMARDTTWDKLMYWDQPYFDCFELDRWISGLSLPFFRNKTGLEFMGVVILDIDLNKTGVNQCDDSDTLFSGTHKCSPETTYCKYSRHGGLEAGNYECQCKSGFSFPVLNATQKYYTGTQVERHFLSVMRGEANYSKSDFQCLPCRQGCVDCEDDGGPCFVEYTILMRGIPLGIQSFCMTITLVLGIVVIRVRKCKVMVIGMWCLLEIILLGALFLYATVVVQYFEPSTTTCLIVPWLRELGFAILYGALVLKIYRLLADFQSRKAHRVHVRDKDLLKYLLCIVVVVIGYMAAWTSVNIDQVQEGAKLIETGETADEHLQYLICKSGWWDYSTEVEVSMFSHLVEALCYAEVVFLVFGIYLCYRVRAAPSEYREGTYISAAICIECFISTTFYILRHIYWYSLHPDYLYLMYFLRCQLTVSVTLVLVFGPKLWYSHRPPDERSIRSRAYSSSDVPDNMAPEVMKLNVGISSNGDVDVGDVSLADMDPEDIRAELKRLYTQLQVYKTRALRKDNPHISKRRGGRKQTHRRFSLQAAFHHKHRHHHDHEPEHEMSKTPEESTNSAEGLPMPIEMSVTKCDEVNEVKPACSVSFKMSHSHKS